MSYILDAIKKAEQQRNKDRMPTLESIGTYDNGSRRRSSSRNFGLVVAAVLFVALGWFHKPILQGISTTAASVSQWVSGLFSGDQPSPVSESQKATESTGSTQTIQPAPTVTTPSPAQQVALDSINIAVISYSSDPNKRFVMSGSRVIREGEAVNGFTILEIRKSSVILDVNGQEHELKF